MSDDHVPGLLHPTKSALLVIDLQTRFSTVIAEFHEIAEMTSRLCRTFRVLGLPMLATEQYPEGLGSMIPVVRREMEIRHIPAKTAFSSYRCDEIRDALGAEATKSVLVVGIEAHICVSQTVHELLAAGFEVHVAVDAVASRNRATCELALRRMEASGAVLTTAETVAYELLRDANHERFRDIQEIHQ